MVYTVCTNACPLTLARMQAVQKALTARGISAHFILVTLDPRHDTSARLAEYRAKHALDREYWTLLRGNRETTTALARQLSIHRIEDLGHLFHISKIVMISADGTRMHVLEDGHLDTVLSAIGSAPASPQQRRR